MRITTGSAAILAMVLGASATGQGTDADEARARLLAHWEAIETLEFRSETQVLGEDGQPDPMRESYRSDAKFGTEGLYVQVYTRFGADGVIVGKPVRAVGRYGRKGMGQSAIDRGLGVLAPVGDPLYRYISRDQPLSRYREPSGRSVLAFMHQERNGSLRCELDPEHDWLPRRVEYRFGRGRPCVIVVERFIRDNGLWFPGEFTCRYGDQPVVRTRVTDLKINRPIADSEFDGMPAGPSDPPRELPNPFSKLRSSPEMGSTGASGP